jgi:hypothetical protein
MGTLHAQKDISPLGASVGGAPHHFVAQSAGPATVLPLLTNASASGTLFTNVYGGNYQLNLAGTVGGATVTVTVSDSSGTQQTVATFTATGTQCLAIPANTSLEINHAEMPDRFSTGIVEVFSTTGCYTKTASSTAELEVQVQ